MARPNRNVIDRDTITIRVPIALRKRGGRKTVITPNGVTALSPTRSRVDGAIVKALARAFRWRKLIETGVCSTVQEIAASENLNASYVSRVLTLTLLAPDIVEAILDRRHAPPIELGVLLGPVTAEWGQQRRNLHYTREREGLDASPSARHL